MLTLEQLVYSYPRVPLCFNLRIRRGERIAILGPSGSGKSTLLRLIAGFLVPTSGRICLGDQDHTRSSPARRPVSMLFQENNLFAHLTVAQNIGLGLHPGLKLNARQQDELQHIALQTGVGNLLPCLPAELSGGQRQRVALARALVRSQPILLLDEPFSSLDTALRNDMLQLLEQVCLQRQLTLLMVSHSLADAARIASRTLLVCNGGIDYDGTTQALLSGSVPQGGVL